MFNGRIGRKTFVLGLLFSAALIVGWGIVAGIIAAVFGMDNPAASTATLYPVMLVMFVLQWSLLIRRAHDLGYSSWFALSFIIPFVNTILLLYFLFAEGEVTTNAHGSVPTSSPLWATIFGRSNVT